MSKGKEKENKAPDKKDAPSDSSDAIIRITEHAHKEISWVHSAYKFIAGAVTLIIAVGIFFTFKSSSELKDELLREGQRAQASQKADFDSLGRKLHQDLQRDVDELRKEVAKRLDAEFDSKQISDLVRDKAKERIDAIADVLIQKAITNQITPIRNEFLDQLTKSKEEIRLRVEKLDEDSKQNLKTETELKNTLAEARELLTKLDEQASFIMTALAAQNDDRSAYEQLEQWSKDTKHKFHSEAAMVIKTIQLNYSERMLGKSYRSLSWKDEAKANAFDQDIILYNWSVLPRSDVAPAYVEFVWAHTNMTKEQKLHFLHSVVKNSRNSLQAADRAAELLSAELKAKYNPPFDFSDINLKWEERLKTNSAPSISTNKVDQSPAK